MSLVGRAAGADPLAASTWQLLALDIPKGTGFGRHLHAEHQLVVVHGGVLGLATPDAVWAVPAGCGAWLPAGADHEVLGIADAAATFAYLGPVDGWTVPAAGA